MKTLSSDKRISAIAADAVLIAAAFALSYLEVLFPLDFLPLPGFKAGLCNIAITVAAFRLSPFHAALVSGTRVILMFLVFGNPTTLLFSLAGSLLVILALTVLTRHNKGLSFIGISVICALAHNAGQFFAALILVGNAIVSYVPFLLAASLVFGTLNGIILNLLPMKIFGHTEQE